ncbi:MAG TPA: hypothetical protein VG963_14255, partial [Polyangiaceae bacterium]|nr:hypothetical protein [Polyangiaceae bacterium]
AEAPAAAELASLRGCDAEALYYGIGESVDFVKARRCAYAEEANGEGTAMGGSAVLMMTYANGQGVPRNFDLALRFACDVGGAPAELDGRVGRLVRARAAGALSEAFDVCDDITSGFMQGICTAHGERLADVGRQARLHAATSDLPQPELAALERAAQAFFEARSQGEVDQTGTARSAFVIEERTQLEDQHTHFLEQLHDAKFTPPQRGEAALDQEMRATLARIAGCSSLQQQEQFAGAITRAGIRDAQARWIDYRAAFVVLAVRVRPQVPPESWRTWLGAKRLEQLQALAEGCQ